MNHAGATFEARRRRRAMIGVGIAGVLAGVLLFVLVLVFVAEDPDTEVRLGDNVFEVGNSRSLAEKIDNQGPLLFADLLNGDLVVFVQHLGGQRWTAFRAFERRERCVLTWHAGSRRFRDPCSPRTYPSDGAGLIHYRTSIDSEGTVVVDLRGRCPELGPC